MNQRMLLRTLSQPRPRYVLLKPHAASLRGETSAGAILAVAFIFWLVYFLMRHLS